MRSGRFAIAVLLAAACGPDAPPGMFVGESAHFRLFVDPALGASSIAYAQENGLAALETEWSDVQTMLKMPEGGGKISYYWLTSDDVGTACDDGGEGACTWEQRLEIDTPLLPNAHELTHAYMYLRRQRHPIPFLAEGIAESIDCTLTHAYAAPNVPWPGVVASEETSDSLVQGGAFMRYLIRRFGIDAVVRYYEQAPERRDPALFAANFESFWGVTMDDAWADVHPASSTAELRICPCSLPPPASSGAPVLDHARVPYWTLPDDPGTSVALRVTGADLDRVHVIDCAGMQPTITDEGVVARLDGAARRYVLPPLADAEIGDFLADDCASAAPYELPASFSGGFSFTVAVPNQPAGSAAVFLELASAAPLTLAGGAQETCPSCGFDQGDCQASTTAVSLQGTTFARMSIYTTGRSDPDLAQARLVFK
jgi:hypothetical protein